MDVNEETLTQVGVKISETAQDAGLETISDVKESKTLVEEKGGDFIQSTGEFALGVGASVIHPTEDSFRKPLENGAIAVGEEIKEMAIENKEALEQHGAGDLTAESIVGKVNEAETRIAEAALFAMLPEDTVSLPLDLKDLLENEVLQLTQRQLAGLTLEQLLSFTREQLKWLTAKQVKGISLDMLIAAGHDFITNFSAEQLKAFTDDQMKYIHEKIKENVHEAEDYVEDQVITFGNNAKEYTINQVENGAEIALEEVRSGAREAYAHSAKPVGKKIGAGAKSGSDFGRMTWREILIAVYFVVDALQVATFAFTSGFSWSHSTLLDIFPKFQLEFSGSAYIWLLLGAILFLLGGVILFVVLILTCCGDNDDMHDFIYDYGMLCTGILFIPLTKVLLESLSCEDVTKGGSVQTVLRQDDETECWTASHITFVVFAMISLLLLLFGSFARASHDNDISHMESEGKGAVKPRIKFLKAKYLLYRLLMTILSVFLAREIPTVTSVLFLGFSFLITLYYTVATPYVNVMLNVVKAGSVSGKTGVFVSTLITVGIDDPDAQGPWWSLLATIPLFALLGAYLSKKLYTPPADDRSQALQFWANVASKSKDTLTIVSDPDDTGIFSVGFVDDNGIDCLISGLREYRENVNEHLCWNALEFTGPLGTLAITHPTSRGVISLCDAIRQTHTPPNASILSLSVLKMRINDDALSQILLLASSLPSLESLIISGCRLTEEQLLLICRKVGAEPTFCPALATLNLSHNVSTSETKDEAKRLIGNRQGCKLTMF
eukprot:GCRY01003020.1.p1 GENE.GCRY01003020.1~~GCRY01003020.1.p1  ORF type:complete len:780 (+),score=78.50 GCRY01003020.1:117-2456(+)